MPDASWIREHGIIAIIRGDYADRITALTGALHDGGVRIVEVTLNSPGALNMIAQLHAAYAEHMWIGAGTVLTEADVRNAAAAGAQFIVSPDTFPPVIAKARELGLEPVPGAYTASEVRTALRSGAQYIKLFPAMPAGPDYLRQIRAPLNDAAFIPTGGVSADNIDAFVRAGAVAFGVGSALVPKAFTGSAADVAALRAKAERLCDALREARTT